MALCIKSLTSSTRIRLLHRERREMHGMIYKAPLLFPGQGTQTVGMIKELAKNHQIAHSLFERASGIVGIDLLKLCIDGPKELLDTTRYSQPAILVTSVACWTAFSSSPAHPLNNVKPTITAGLSLGEYTALCIAGVISFDDAVNLIRIRGDEMQKACDNRVGKMSTIIGLEVEKLEMICQEISRKMNLIVHIGNYLAPKYYAITGDTAAVNEVIQQVSMFPGVTHQGINVSGAFHSELMLPAKAILTKAIENTSFAPPSIPIIMNVNSYVYHSSADIAQNHAVTEQIKANLIAQLTTPVQWEQSMRKIIMEHGHPSDIHDPVQPVVFRNNTCIEVGPGKSCSVLLKKFNRRQSVISYEPC